MKRLLLILALLSASCSAQMLQAIFTGSAGASLASTLGRQFNGSSDFLVTASTIDTSTTKIISISFRYFNNSGAGSIFDGLNWDAGTAGSWLINPGASTYTIAYTSGSGNNNVATFPSPSNTTWHHYLVVLDMATLNSFGSTAVYVDGSLQTLTPVATGTASAFFANANINLMRRASATNFNAGRLSDVWVWKAGESSNAASLASCGTAPNSVDTANIVAGWPIKQVSPETPGTSGGAINLTVTGTTNVAGMCP